MKIGDDYSCGACGQTFMAVVSEDDEMAEMSRLFGDIPPEQQVRVCDGCFQIIMAWRVETGY